MCTHMVTRCHITHQRQVSPASLRTIQYMSVSIIPDVLMGFGGTTEPCAQVHLTSIGKLGELENKRISQGVAAFMQTHLGVPSDRWAGVCASWH